jgi:EmrB/QacA subfamily drug resistance transporter
MSAGPTVAAEAPVAPMFTPRQIIIVFLGVMLVFFLASLDQAIVATALPHIAADLDGDSHLSWVVSGYLLASTAVTPIYGKLSDFYGRKPLLQAAIIIFLAASVLCALAWSMPSLIAFRVLQGIGCGGLFSMAQATIGDVVSPRERGRYQGYISVNYALSSVLGPALGGFFSDHLSWRWIFWINLPIGLLALVATQVTLKNLAAKGIRHRIDYPGALLIVAALVAILLITTAGGNEIAWHSAGMLGLAIAAVVLCGLAVTRELQAEEAILPPRLFRAPTFSMIVTLSLFVSACLIGSSVFLPLFMQLVFGFSASMTGLLVIPQSIGVVVGALPAGRWITRTGRYRPLPIFGSLICAAGLFMLSTVGHASTLWPVLCYMAMTSTGAGMAMPALLMAGQNAVDPRDLGAGTATINCFRFMGASFGVALFGAVVIGVLNARFASSHFNGVSALGLLHAGPHALAETSAALRGPVSLALEQAFAAMFRVGAGMALLCCVMAFWMKELPLRTTSGMAARAERQNSETALDLHP